MLMDLVLLTVRRPKQTFKKVKNTAQVACQILSDDLAEKPGRYFSITQTSNIVLESKRFWSSIFKFWRSKSTIFNTGFGNYRVLGASLQGALSCC